MLLQVFRLDISRSTEKDTVVEYGSFSSTVASIIAWKNFLAISIESGVEFRSIDNKETNHFLPSHHLV